MDDFGLWSPVIFEEKKKIARSQKLLALSRQGSRTDSAAGGGGGGVVVMVVVVMAAAAVVVMVEYRKVHQHRHS